MVMGWWPAAVVVAHGSGWLRSFERGEKELMGGDGNHYDYSDSPAQIDSAVAHVSLFFHSPLAA
jgi:hypothetical protein